MKLSKSKLALAKVINENGGWVDDSANWAAQPKHEGGDVWFSTSESKPYSPRGDSGFTFNGYGVWLGAPVKFDKLLVGWHQTVLSSEEYYQAYPKADADGWIEWKGGECPEVNLRAGIKRRDGLVMKDCAMSDFRWNHEYNKFDIIAYRPHKPEVKTEFCESVMLSIPESELDDAESRLAKALELVKASAPHLLSDKYKFNGDEVMGERKPTIEQLAQDYRNARARVDGLRKEVDEAAKVADDKLCELIDAGNKAGLLVSPRTGGGSIANHLTYGTGEVGI